MPNSAEAIAIRRFGQIHFLLSVVKIREEKSLPSRIDGHLSVTERNCLSINVLLRNHYSARKVPAVSPSNQKPSHRLLSGQFLCPSNEKLRNLDTSFLPQ